MRERRWIIWLHRVGYATTAIVLAEALFVVSMIGYDRYWRYQQRVEYRRSTAYGEGQFREIDYLVPDLACLPSFSALGSDGLRFIARPELEWRTYAVAFRLRPNRSTADGILIVRDEMRDKPTAMASYPFHVSAADYRWLTRRIDTRLDGFKGGNALGGLDGTSLAFERVRAGHVTSGGANNDQPYQALGEDVLRVLHRSGVAASLPPIGHDWYRPEPAQ